MGLSSKLLLDASGTPEVDSISSLTDRGRDSNLTLRVVVVDRGNNESGISQSCTAVVVLGTGLGLQIWL